MEIAFRYFSIYNVEISEDQFYKIKVQKEEFEDIKLYSIEEIESIMNSGDKQYKFPQNSEMAIKLIKKRRMVK